MIQELEEEQAICELFSVTESEARVAVTKAGKELRSIQKYLRKKKQVGRCKLCGKWLTDDESVRRGYGKTCYRKIHGDDNQIKLEV